MFLSLFMGQGAYCAEGIDINELKKIKNVKSLFKKKPKENKAPKELKLEEVPIDKSTFSSFEDIDDDMYSNSIGENEVKVNNKPKKKRNFFNFKRKNKEEQQQQDEIIQEETTEENPITTNEVEQGTYINDTPANHHTYLPKFP